MTVTKLDTYFYQGKKAVPELSSYVGLNPGMSPAHFTFAGAAAAREGLGSQVAYRLAIDYFVAGLIEHYNLEESASSFMSEEATMNALQHAFRNANSSVYSFSHKLAAGGRLAASLVGVVFQPGRLAAARAGSASVYLFRNGALLPFFESALAGELVGDAPEFIPEDIAHRISFVGVQSLVDVEIASVELLENDIVCVFSRPLSPLNETLLLEALQAQESQSTKNRNENRLDLLCKDVFTESETLSFAALVQLGPDSILIR